MHHAAETDGSDFFQRDAVGLFHILRHFLITALEAFPDILQRITPDVVHITVFPVIAALGDGMGILIYQYCLDSRGTKFDAEDGSALLHCLFCIHTINLPLLLVYCSRNTISPVLSFMDSTMARDT